MFINFPIIQLQNPTQLPPRRRCFGRRLSIPRTSRERRSAAVVVFSGPALGPADPRSSQQGKATDHFNGNFRILNSRYLPHIRPIFWALCKGIYPQKIFFFPLQYLQFRILELPLIIGKKMVKSPKI